MACAGDTVVHPPSDPSIPLGLYDLVVTQVLEAQLAALNTKLIDVGLADLDPGDSHVPLADHLRDTLRQQLGAIPTQDRIRAQISLCNRLIAILKEQLGDDLSGQCVADRAQRLLYLRKSDPGRPAPDRPDTPLGQGCLLTGTRLDPSLVSQLRSANSWSGTIWSPTTSTGGTSAGRVSVSMPASTPTSPIPMSRR
jgi:hypothetical protein